MKESLIDLVGLSELKTKADEEKEKRGVTIKLIDLQRELEVKTTLVEELESKGITGELLIATYTAMEKNGVAKTTLKLSGDEYVSPNYILFKRLLKAYEVKKETLSEILSELYQKKEPLPPANEEITQLLTKEIQKYLTQSNPIQKEIVSLKTEYEGLQTEKINLEKEIAELKTQKEAKTLNLAEKTTEFSEQRAKIDANTQLFDDDTEQRKLTEISQVQAKIIQELAEIDRQEKQLGETLQNLNQKIEKVQGNIQIKNDEEKKILNTIKTPQEVIDKNEAIKAQLDKQRIEKEKREKLEEALKKIKEDFNKSQDENPQTKPFLYCITKAYNSSGENFETFLENFTNNLKATEVPHNNIQIDKELPAYKEMEECYKNMRTHFGDKQIEEKDLEKALKEQSFFQRLWQAILEFFSISKPSIAKSLNILSKTFTERLKDEKITHVQRAIS
jgi:hypothetical protein